MNIDKDNYMNINIACCLCVKNCYKFLPKIFDNLDLLSKEFKNFNVIFVYDNCNDKSNILLNKYKATCNYNFYLINNINNKSPYRTVRIADARNKCLDIIFNTIKNIDFHFMIDSDDVNTSKWNIDIIKKYLITDDWDSISFNREKYYDIWALLYDNYKHHCWGYKDSIVSHKICDHMQEDIQNKLNNSNESNESENKEELIECLSAFNGFAIYRTNKFNNILYDGLYENIKTLINDDERNETVLFLKNIFPDLSIEIDENTVEHCEHVYYHLSSIKYNNARIRISKYCL
jgi:hypothetical protein